MQVATNLLCLLLHAVLSRAFVDRDECGVFNPGQYALTNGTVAMKNRIINGFKVAVHRPWMASLQKASGLRHHHFCGGTIITKRFVLSAGHCFCHDVPGDCSKQNKGRPKVLEGERARRFSVVVGVLNAGDPRAPRYAVSRVVLPKDLQTEEEPWAQDLSLLQMKVPIVFGEHVKPICLPSATSREKVETALFASGWGNLRRQGEDGQDSCHTTQFGPQTFKRCRLEQGKNSQSPVNCFKESPPNHDVCAEFLNKTKVDRKVDVAVVEGQKCFLQKHNKFGWCYTAEGATKENWGFCLPACQYRVKQGGHDHLREVALTIVKREICATGSHKTIAPGVTELCIGAKLRKPVYGFYTKSQDKFVLTNATKEREYLHVGTRDACFGDSGGPYFNYEIDDHDRLRAVQIGIVSRGVGCAFKNLPGVATRVLPFLPWLSDQTHENLLVDKKMRRTAGDDLASNLA